MLMHATFYLFQGSAVVCQSAGGNSKPDAWNNNRDILSQPFCPSGNTFGSNDTHDTNDADVSRSIWNCPSAAVNIHF